MVRWTGLPTANGFIAAMVTGSNAFHPRPSLRFILQSLLSQHGLNLIGKKALRVCSHCY